MTRPAGRTRPKHRRFRLTVTAVDGSTYGLAIAETNGQASHTHTVATVRPADIPRLTETLHVTLRASRKPPTAIGPARRRPVDIDEAPGVRLTLAALAVEPLRRRDRVREILEGIVAMSDEEAYYWYAKAAHPHTGPRALRALRLLLSEEER